ncbi:MAG: hypothetical protein J4G01_05245 [Dehalococcoidia bacterium]|nr:hypothetical protein [Dehalococcoidia bacterium]
MDLSPMLLATTNPHKLDKLRWLIKGLPIECVTPSLLGIPPDTIPPELGASHEAIARSKAVEWSRIASLPAIATDGGLRIPALGDSWSSLTTGRFAGEGATNREKALALLEAMASFKGGERRATWVEALALAEEGRCVASWEVAGAEGVLLDELPSVVPDAGFWVFPLWYIPMFGKTYDQLGDGELAQIDDHWTQLRDRVRSFFRDHQKAKP